MEPVKTDSQADLDRVMRVIAEHVRRQRSQAGGVNFELCAVLALQADAAKGVDYPQEM